VDGSDQYFMFGKRFGTGLKGIYVGSGKTGLWVAGYDDGSTVSNNVANNTNWIVFVFQQPGGAPHLVNVNRDMHDVIGLRPQSGFCDPNTCGAAQYVDRSNRTCQNCDTSCATCTGPTTGDCLTCSGGETLMGGRCCASNQFNNGAACAVCNTCLTCDGPTSNDCLTCPAATHT
jgi:hypothetical protein